MPEQQCPTTRSLCFEANEGFRHIASRAQPAVDAAYLKARGDPRARVGGSVQGSDLPSRHRRSTRQACGHASHLIDSDETAHVQHMPTMCAMCGACLAVPPSMLASI